MWRLPNTFLLVASLGWWFHTSYMAAINQSLSFWSNTFSGRDVTALEFGDRMIEAVSMSISRLPRLRKASGKKKCLGEWCFSSATPTGCQHHWWLSSWVVPIWLEACLLGVLDEYVYFAISMIINCIYIIIYRLSMLHWITSKSSKRYQTKIRWGLFSLLPIVTMQNQRYRIQFHVLQQNQEETMIIWWLNSIGCDSVVDIVNTCLWLSPIPLYWGRLKNQ